MNEILLPETFGTILNSEKEAVLLAIQEKKDVIFVFADIQYRVTLAQAHVKLPLLLTRAFEERDGLMKNFMRRVDETGKDLIRLLETMGKM